MSESTQTPEVPPLHRVLQLGQDYGLVGEQETFLSLILASIYSRLVLVLGPAGTGKTHLIETADKVMGGKSMYFVSTTGSPKALFYDADTMNSHRIHVYGDVDGLDEARRQVFKAHGEGKIADHKIADAILDDVREKKLYPPDTLIAAFATDNENIDRGGLAEIMSRAFELFTDSSVEQTERIIEMQAKRRSNLVEIQVDSEHELAIHNHLSKMGPAVSKYKKMPANGMDNPVAYAIAKEKILPTQFVNTRRDHDKLLDLFEAVTLYHAPERMTYQNSRGGENLLVAPVDVWMAMKILGEKMLMSCLNLSNEDLAILQVIRQRKAALSKSKVKEILMNDLHINMTTREIGRALDGMTEKGYVNKNDDVSPITYQPGFFHDQVDHSIAVDWASVVESTKENACESLPIDVADEYISRYCEGDGLIGVHPLTGEEINILEDDEFETDFAEQAEKLEDVLADSPFASASPGSSANEDSTEGTLT